MLISLQIVYDNIAAFIGLKVKQYCFLLVCEECYGLYSAGIQCRKCFGEDMVYLKASGCPYNIRRKLTFEDYRRVLREQQPHIFEARQIIGVNHQPTVVTSRRIGLMPLDYKRYNLVHFHALLRKLSHCVIQFVTNFNYRYVDPEQRINLPFGHYLLEKHGEHGADKWPESNSQGSSTQGISNSSSQLHSTNWANNVWYVTITVQFTL